MRIARLAALGCAAVVLCGAASSSPVRVPQSEIDAVNIRWQSLGVVLPNGGIVLAEPFQPPYSNRSFIVPPTWFWDVAGRHLHNPNFTVSAANMRADLPVLRLLLQKVYIAYQSAEDRGWNWDAWFDSWDQALAGDGDAQISLHAALAPWGKLVDFQPDGHLGPFIAGFNNFARGSSVTAELASAPAGTCTTIHFVNGGSIALLPTDTGRQPHAVHAWNGARLLPAWYIDYPQREGQASSIDCAGKNIALQMTAQPRRGSAGPVYQPLGNGIAYLRAPFLFDYANNRALGNVLSKAHGVGKERVLLFDLRGNGGGAAPTNLLTYWFSQSEIAAASLIGDRETTDSCFKNGLMFNMFQYFSYTLRPPLSPDMKHWMQHVVDGLSGPTQANGCDVKEKVTYGAPPPPQTPFTEQRSTHGRTRVVVLIDNGCGSDCVRMAVVLSRLPDTAIAGTSLGEASSFGTAVPALVVLPHTRIPFIMGTEMGSERQKGIGEITVDVLLPTMHSQEMRSLIALAYFLGR